MNDSSLESTSISEASRCEYRFTNGKQCRMLRALGEPHFCPQHAKLVQNVPLEQDISEYLLKGNQGFQTAQGINFSLCGLYELVAQNRISTKRAAVLAYIASLLLRTHPAIDADNHANVKDPWLDADLDPAKKPS